MKRVRNRKGNKQTKKVPKAVRSYVRKQISKDEETKYSDNIFQAGVSLTGTIADMLTVAQGTTDQQRIGDKIRLRGSLFRLKMTGMDPTNFVRIILFQWYPNTNLSVPTVATILFDTSTADRAITSHYVHDYENQFHVIYDKVFTLVVGDDSNIRQKVFKPKFKYVKKQVEFFAAGANASNKLYMLAISDSGVAPNPDVFATWRIYYDDA